MEKKQIIGLSVGLLVIFLAGILLVTFPAPMLPGNKVACTMEAMLCPDGSSVGRVGPDCEFTACPDTGDQPAYGFVYTYFESQYPLGADYSAFDAVAVNEVQATAMFESLFTDSSSTCLELVDRPVCVGSDNVNELNIDWNSSFLFALSIGQRSSGGYSLDVVDYEETDSTIKIFLEESTPGENCMTTYALTSPMLIASVPIPAERAAIKDVVFSIEQVTSIYCE